MKFTVRGESHIVFRFQCIMMLAGGGVIDHDISKIRKVSNFKDYILLKPICAGEVSVVIAIEKYYTLVSTSKGNTMVKTKKIKNVQLLLFFNVKM